MTSRRAGLAISRRRRHPFLVFACFLTYQASSRNKNGFFVVEKGNLLTQLKYVFFFFFLFSVPLKYVSPHISALLLSYSASAKFLAFSFLLLTMFEEMLAVSFFYSGNTMAFSLSFTAPPAFSVQLPSI